MICLAEVRAILNHSQAQEPDSTERAGTRRWTRYTVNLSLRVRVPTTSGQEFMLAHGRDVSQGGMAVYVPVELEIGETILLELIFPTLPGPLRLSATVKNRFGFKYGVEFMEPAPEQQKTILIHLHKLLLSTRSG